jgi:hypothetical protein
MEESWESMAEAVERIAQTNGDSHLVEWTLNELKRCREQLRRCLSLIAENGAHRQAHSCASRSCGPRASRMGRGATRVRGCSPRKRGGI